MEKLIRKDVLSITPYIPGKPIEETKRQLGLKEVIKLASNENPIGSSYSFKPSLPSGAGNAFLSIFPFGVNGKFSNTIICDGCM